MSLSSILASIMVFWGSVSETMIASANDLDIDLEIFDAGRDRLRMIRMARNVIERAERPDYAIVVNELQQGSKLAQMFEKAQIPYLFLLNRLSEEQLDQLRASRDLNHYLGSITPRNTDTGYETAKALIERARLSDRSSDRLRILALLGDTATPAATEREAGMRRAVSEYPDVDIVRVFSVDWLFQRAKSAVSPFLKSNSADIIWTASGPITFGAQEVVGEFGLEPGRDIFFAGVGWFPDALSAVQSEKMTMTYGGYFIAGAWSMIVLRDSHAGIELENGGKS